MGANFCHGGILLLWEHTSAVRAYFCYRNIFLLLGHLFFLWEHTSAMGVYTFAMGAYSCYRGIYFCYGGHNAAMGYLSAMGASFC